MREYAKVSPRFWIGDTGRAIRRLGPEAQLLALYMLSGPHANMIGLYYLPKAYMAHDTGIPIEGASKALLGLIEAGFCTYDEDTEMVWVHEMARFQVGDELKPTDKRCAGIASTYAEAPKCPMLSGFFDRYADHYHLPTRREYQPKGSPIEAPSKPLPSQEQEQEQEQRTGAGAEKHAQSPEPDDPIAIHLQLNTGAEFPIRASQVVELQKLYPATNVVSELAKMRGWLIGNPTKRKTRAGVMKFVTNWLARQQDNAPMGAAPIRVAQGLNKQELVEAQNAEVVARIKAKVEAQYPQDEAPPIDAYANDPSAHAPLDLEDLAHA